MGSLMMISLYNHCWVRGWNDFENRSMFSEVIGN